MGTVPTGKMESQLRAEYLRWLSGLPAHQDDLTGYVSTFEARSRALIARMGGQVASLGALGDFPVPKLLELSPVANVVYDQMAQAAIQASIQAGMQASEAAKALMNAGLGKSFNRLNRLARTETVSAYWRNSWDSVADLPDIVMVWSAEHGKRTCEWCLSREGLVVEDANLRDHPQGRCTLIPTLRSRLQYKGTLEPDGSVTMDPRYTSKSVAGARPKASAGPTTEAQRDPMSGKSNPAAPSRAQAAQSSIEGKDFRSMTSHEKVKAAETMYGTGSKQHLAAIKKFSDTPLKPAAVQPVKVEAPRVIKSVKDMESFGSAMLVPSTITKGAAKAMDDYAKGTAYAANAVLRGQKTVFGRAIDPRTKTYAKGFTKEVDKMMDASLIPEDVRVVRALGADAFGGLDKLKDLAGGIYQDKGYMSTSLAEKVSKSVYDVKDAVEMEINVPKGTRALYMAGESYLKTERELLLDRGTRLAVESVTYDERKKTWKVVATVLPGPR